MKNALLRAAHKRRRRLPVTSRKITATPYRPGQYAIRYYDGTRDAGGHLIPYNLNVQHRGERMTEEQRQKHMEDYEKGVFGAMTKARRRDAQPRNWRDNPGPFYHDTKRKPKG
jgi:hypothetical protein